MYVDELDTYCEYCSMVLRVIAHVHVSDAGLRHADSGRNCRGELALEGASFGGALGAVAGAVAGARPLRSDQWP